MRGLIGNKNGQQMALGTIIAIILGLVVLVFLIFGFTKGWGNLWDNISNLGGGDSNVDSVVRGCEIACASENTNAYCVQNRTVNFGKDSAENPNTLKGSCEYLVTNGKISIDCSMDC